MSKRYKVKRFSSCYLMNWVDNKTNKELTALEIEEILHKQEKRIAELQKQLEEKEKDNQFFKKMYLSEKQKNDNYHTEKYGLDKPVEELRKIKLTPKEKEIYYKGFDNCERQFATHIAELQKQLQEKEEEIEELQKDYEFKDKDCAINLERFCDALTKNVQLEFLIKDLQSELKSQPAEIVEKIKEFVDGNAYYYEEIK